MIIETTTPFTNSLEAQSFLKDLKDRTGFIFGYVTVTEKEPQEFHVVTTMLTRDQAILAFINDARSVLELPPISTLPETCQQLAEALGALDVARHSYTCPHFTAGFTTHECADRLKKLWERLNEVWDRPNMPECYDNHIPANRVTLPPFLAGFAAAEIPGIPLEDEPTDLLY